MTTDIPVERNKRRIPRRRVPITVAKSRSPFDGEPAFFLRIATRQSSGPGEPIPASYLGVTLPESMARLLHAALGRALDMHDNSDAVTIHPGADDT